MCTMGIHDVLEMHPYMCMCLLSPNQPTCGFYLVAMDTVPLLQENVFSAIGRPIIDSCMCGYNGTIFA